MYGAKEMHEQTRQSEIDFLPQEELHERQYLYCNGCSHNWASLPSMEADGDEQYEYCPICGTAEHLTEQQLGPKYTFNPITGEILDAATGEIIHPVLPELPPVPKGNVPWTDLQYTKAEQEAREDSLLEEHFKKLS